MCTLDGCLVTTSFPFNLFYFCVMFSSYRLHGFTLMIRSKMFLGCHLSEFSAKSDKFYLSYIFVTSVLLIYSHVGVCSRLTSCVRHARRGCRRSACHPPGLPTDLYPSTAWGQSSHGQSSQDELNFIYLIGIS